MNINTKRSARKGLSLSLLLFVFLNQSFSQDLGNIKVSLKSNNKPLYEVLDDLSKQCGFYFTFDSRLIDSHQEINISQKEISLQSAIDTLFNDDDLSYKIINRNIVIFPRSKRKTTQVNELIEENYKLLEVHGTITDIKSEKPLPFASISVLDTYYGTISNDDGSFILRIPDTINQTILVSSYIGYKNQYTPISFNNREPISIQMNKSLVSLQEVIIRYQDPVGLLSESLKRLSENYMSQPAGMQAYYREKVSKEDKCMLFSEAVVEIAKASYSNSFAIERSRILKGRKITNIDFQDTVLLKIQSGLNSMLQLDIIKNPPLFLSEDFNSMYNLQFADVVSFKDKLVYVISFEQKESVQDMLFRGDIYIDRDNLAIISADFSYDPLRLTKEEQMFVTKKSRTLKITPVSASYHVEYNQGEAGYHLSQAQGEVKFKLRKRRQWIASKYSINIELAITNIDPGNPPHIRAGEQLKPGTIISDQEFNYDPEFWGEYTTIAPETSLTEALLKIEKSMKEVDNVDPN